MRSVTGRSITKPLDPSDAVEILERFQHAMVAFDADALADLYAPDAVQSSGS
jgi:ketosteroid isomerase-like protein